MIVKDCCEEDHRKIATVNDTEDYAFWKFFVTFLGSFSNLQTLQMHVRSYIDFAKLEPKLRIGIGRLSNTNLQVLKIYFNEVTDSRIPSRHLYRSIVLNQLVKANPNLQRLVFQSLNKCNELKVSFSAYRPPYNTPNFLKEITIDCPRCTIYHECLKYIISDTFANLEALNLFSAYMGSYRNNDFTLEDLKKRCLTIKNYNVCLLSNINWSIIFTIDNCKKDEDRYASMTKRRLNES